MDNSPYVMPDTKTTKNCHFEGACDEKSCGKTGGVKISSAATDLKEELAELRDITDSRFQIVFETLDQLIAADETSKHKIGFTAKEKQGTYKT